MCSIRNLEEMAIINSTSNKFHTLWWNWKEHIERKNSHLFQSKRASEKWGKIFFLFCNTWSYITLRYGCFMWWMKWDFMLRGCSCHQFEDTVIEFACMSFRTPWNIEWGGQFYIFVFLKCKSKKLVLEMKNMDKWIHTHGLYYMH
jgi:hypothetical protein